MQGGFFSSPNADEAILQIEFAKELIPQTKDLIGKDLVLRLRRTAIARFRIGRRRARIPAVFQSFRKKNIFALSALWKPNRLRDSADSAAAVC